MADAVIEARQPAGVSQSLPNLARVRSDSCRGLLPTDFTPSCTVTVHHSTALHHALAHSARPLLNVGRLGADGSPSGRSDLYEAASIQRVTRSHPLISFLGNQPKPCRKSRFSAPVSSGGRGRYCVGNPARVYGEIMALAESLFGTVGMVLPMLSHHTSGVWWDRRADLDTIWVLLTCR